MSLIAEGASPLKFPGTHLGPILFSKGAREYVATRVFADSTEDEDELHWFFSKRANASINQWLQNAGLTVLEPYSPNNTGVLRTTHERILHAVDSRSRENVPREAVEELLVQLLVTGAPAFAPNMSSGDRVQGYDHQLLMFMDAYKSKLPAVSGKSPAAVLGLELSPFPHFKLVTAYWIRDQKAKALRRGALK